jgi:alpha-tubulin suppressor-like RCC1 family protein
MGGRGRSTVVLRRSVAALTLVAALAGCRGAGWGHNALGQLGDGSTANRDSPTATVGPGWLTVDAGGGHSCGIDVQRRAWCWGSDSNGQLGNGSASADQPAPVLVSGGATDYTSIDAGAAHTCAIRADGTLWCWGYDHDGQLGDGIPGEDRVGPHQVPGTGWRQVWAGASTTCATRTDDTLWCWGDNTYGQVGAGTHDALHPSPTQVDGTDWASVTGGEFHTCGLRTDGTAWCWGLGDDGILGRYGDGPNHVPVQVPGVWTSFESGLRHVCGVQADHTAWCWGFNGEGQLGLGFVTDNAWERVTEPTQLPGDDWLAISAGAVSTCGLRLDHTAWCWGENSWGALGDGTDVDSPSPVAVAGGGMWMEVSVGWVHVVGVRWPNSG